jgi:hypothetical protein
VKDCKIIYCKTDFVNLFQNLGRFVENSNQKATEYQNNSLLNKFNHLIEIKKKITELDNNKQKLKNEQDLIEKKLAELIKQTEEIKNNIDSNEQILKKEKELIINDIVLTGGDEKYYEMKYYKYKAKLAKLQNK